MLIVQIRLLTLVLAVLAAPAVQLISVGTGRRSEARARRLDAGGNVLLGLVLVVAMVVGQEGTPLWLGLLLLATTVAALILKRRAERLFDAIDKRG